jgi:hypothetical protein
MEVTQFYIFFSCFIFLIYVGLLFSIEVTSTYYPITNYYFSYVAVLSGSYTFLALWNLFLGMNRFHVAFESWI